MPLMMGPSHPAMHGTVRIALEVEGEKIKTADIQIGYLHRCFEKEAEYATWTQIFPYTDRLNYVSPMLNNVGYAMAVEKLLDIDDKIPERAQYIRVIVGEISRITDHLTCLGAGAMELGAFTVFFYLIKAREWLWELLEEVSGARLTHSYVRIGGVVADLPEGWPAKLLDILAKTRGVLGDADKLLTRNKIFRDRMDGVGHHRQGATSRDGADRSRGALDRLAYDVRKDHPYLVYDRLRLRRPRRLGGRQLRSLCLPHGGDLSIDAYPRTGAGQDPDGARHHRRSARGLPAQEARDLQHHRAMIAHFKLIMDGMHVPAGEIYSFTEGGNGELGFYIVSNGEGRPWKCRVRPPCFANLAVLTKVLPGLFIADVVPTFGMINMIGGECDR
jgi:NADH-quinone oxidoreductase subunit D